MPESVSDRKKRLYRSWSARFQGILDGKNSASFKFPFLLVPSAPRGMCQLSKYDNNEVKNGKLENFRFYYFINF
jgi:hypothetical protein